MKHLLAFIPAIFLASTLSAVATPHETYAVETAPSAERIFICAQENEVCILSHGSTFYFGDGTRHYRIQSGRSTEVCSVANLGVNFANNHETLLPDPLRGRRKFCYYRVNFDDYNFTHCSGEWVGCYTNFAGATGPIPASAPLGFIRFGRPGAWVYRAVKKNSMIPCNIHYFGDPAPNQVKTCQQAISRLLN